MINEEQIFKPTVNKPVNDQSKNLIKNYRKTMYQQAPTVAPNIRLNEIDSMLSEAEFSLKKKIFSLPKMEALVFSDPKLRAVYDEMSVNGEEKYGYHYNETIQNMIFNDYVLNSPKYLQKYKMAIPKEKKRRDKSGINQAKKAGEETMKKMNPQFKPKKLDPSGLPKQEKKSSQLNEEVTKVQFLVNEKDPENPDLFAYFPDSVHHDDYRDCYSHIGQHSSCHPDYAAESRPATPEEYADLKAELENQVGYELDVADQANETTGTGASSGAFVGKLKEDEEETQYQPDDEDCFIESNGWKYSVSCGGKFISEFNEMDDALNAVKTWKQSNKWFPNTWFISDHGNVSLIDDEGNIINETTTAGSAGGAAGYVGYAGPAAWGGGDLMKGKKSNVMRKPIWKGGTIIAETNYLTDPSGFERFAENIDDEIIDKTAAFNSDTVKGWDDTDKQIQMDRIKTGQIDKPNLNLVEKATSKAQQRLFGMAHAVQKGELSPSKVGGAVKKIAKTVNPDDVEDFASTKHDDLPEKIDEYFMPDALIGDDIVNIEPRSGEKPFTIDGNKYQFETATYDDGRKDIVVYSFRDDVYYDYAKWQNAMGIGIREETQTMIQSNGTSMSNKPTPAGEQGSGVPMGIQASGGMSEDFIKNGNYLYINNNEMGLLEELNKELEAFSVHHNKLKLMAEDKKPSSLVMKDRLGSENEKNFKKDMQASGTKEIIDVEKELQWKDQQTDVGDDPQKLGQDIEKKVLKVTGGNALKNVGDSANDEGDEIPKRNRTTPEQDDVDMHRLGQQDLVYDNEPGKRFEDRMKADMGEKLYAERQKKLKWRSEAPMYNKDPQPVEDTEVDKDQFNKEKSTWNKRDGIGESVVTGRYYNSLGKRCLVDFKLNETLEIVNEKDIENYSEVNLTGLGNVYNSRGEINEGVNNVINKHKFYTDGVTVYRLKAQAQKLNESKQNVKPVINEQFEKIKHLTGYKPNEFVDTKNVKKNRGF